MLKKEILKITLSNEFISIKINIYRPKSYGVNFNMYNPFSTNELLKFSDSNRKPTVFTQHAIFSKDIEKLYPKNETYRFTILRGNFFSQIYI